jgi:hypothetical protein
MSGEVFYHRFPRFETSDLAEDPAGQTVPVKRLAEVRAG